MAERRRRALRQQFDADLRIRLEGQEEFLSRYASNLSTGGMFIQTATPTAVGSLLTIEFLLPNGSVLSRVSGRVARARPGTGEDDETAGMGIEFVALDAAAKTAAQVYVELSGDQQLPKERAEPPHVLVDSLEAPEPSEDQAVEGPVVGIDLGTTNSCVACVIDGEPKLVIAPGGYEAVPSVVYISPERKVLIGHKAVEKMVLDSRRAVYGSKRFIGRPYVSKEVHAFGQFFQYDLTAGKGGRVGASIDGTSLPLEIVSGYILAHLREVASKSLDQDVRRCIITVPAHFGETQRKSVRDAARLAGLHVERLLGEPTAAAVAYGYGRGRLCTVLVYDIGGGTFDVSIMNVIGDQMTVLAADGEPFLGGSDFDDRLTEHALFCIEKEYDIDARGDNVIVQRVRFAVELAKRQLSETETAAIDLPYLKQTPSGWLSPRLNITRQTLETLTEDLVQRTLERVDAVLYAAKLKPHEINDILLVGGQSRSPHIRRRLEERFGRAPSRNIHPDQAVALGAAIVGEAVRNQLPVSLTDVLPASIRFARADGTTDVLLPRGRALPAGTLFEVEMSAPEGEEPPQYVVSLCRGESSRAADNEPLGDVRVPGSLELAEARTMASVGIRVTADGLLQATLRHPVTGEVNKLDLRMQDADDPADMLEFEDLELMPPPNK